MISVAKKPRPSHRAKIGASTPVINRRKHTNTVKKECDIKTKKNAGIFLKDATVTNCSLFYIFGITVASFQNITAIFFRFYVEFFFYRLGVFTPIFAR